MFVGEDVDMSTRLDDENVILKDLRDLCDDLPKKYIYFLTNSRLEKKLYKFIIKRWNRIDLKQERSLLQQNLNKIEKLFCFILLKKCNKWTINNAHNDPPPDYYSSHYKIMFDVMRVNDSEIKYINAAGEEKYRNPVLVKESILFKNQRAMYPNVQPEQILINLQPDECYWEEHTYEKYCNHVCRVLQDHLKSAEMCKRKHKNWKMGFLVMDETEIYVQCKNVNDISGSIDQIKQCEVEDLPHVPFLDQRMMNLLMNSEIDFLIWFCPYKAMGRDILNFPLVTFIDLQKMKTLKCVLKEYPEKSMISL